jgi:hypothetical protein
LKTRPEPIQSGTRTGTSAQLRDIKAFCDTVDGRSAVLLAGRMACAAFSGGSFNCAGSPLAATSALDSGLQFQELELCFKNFSPLGLYFSRRIKPFQLVLTSLNRRARNQPSTEPGQRRRHEYVSVLPAQSMCVVWSTGRYVLGIARDGVGRLGPR